MMDYSPSSNIVLTFKSQQHMHPQHLAVQRTTKSSGKKDKSGLHNVIPKCYGTQLYMLLVPWQTDIEKKWTVNTMQKPRDNFNLFRCFNQVLRQFSTSVELRTSRHFSMVFFWNMSKNSCQLYYFSLRIKVSLQQAGGLSQALYWNPSSRRSSLTTAVKWYAIGTYNVSHLDLPKFVYLL